MNSEIIPSDTLESNSINYDEIRRYFEFLSGPGGAVECCCFMDAESKQPLSGLGTWFGSVDDLLLICSGFSPGCFTLHTALNTTNCRGRKNKDIESPRCYCVDLDVPRGKDELKLLIEIYKVHAVIESSPGKYHLYWKCSAATPLKHWASYQAALAFGFGGDSNFNQIAKTIRVPGVPRVCKDGSLFVPHIVYLAENIEEITESKLPQYFPEINQWMKAAETAQKERRREVREAAAQGTVPAGVSAGGRNSTLFGLLSELMRGKGRPETEDALAASAEALNGQFQEPLEPQEVAKIVGSVWRNSEEWREKRAEVSAGLLGKIEAFSTVNGNGHHADQAFNYNYSTGALALNRFTETAVEQRVHQRFGNRMIRADNILYAFDAEETTWKVQNQYPIQIADFVGKCVDDTLADPDFLTALCTNADKEFSEEKAKRAQDRFSSVSLRSRLTAAIKLSAKVRKETAHIFDSKENLFYLANGVLDLNTEELRGALPEDYLLKRSNVFFEPGADCPRFMQFLADIFAKNFRPQETIDFMQEVFAYSLTGSIAERKVFCHYGDGCNGKSKLLYALRLLTGAYTNITDPDYLVKVKNARVKDTEKFGPKVEGHRNLIVDDIDSAATWSENFLKTATANEISCRGEYEVYRVIPNRCKLHLGLNVYPTIESENNSIIERLCIIPYNRQFESNGAVSEALDRGFREELSGILNWAIEGYKRLKARGCLLVPDEIKATKEEYRSEQFQIEGTLKTLIAVPEIGSQVIPVFAYEIREELNRRLSETGHGVLTSQAFEKAMRRSFSMLESKKMWCPERKNMYTAYSCLKRFEKESLPSLLKPY